MRDIVEQLAAKSASGDLYLKLAEMYLSDQEYGLAFRAANRGLEKGRLSNQRAARKLQLKIGDMLGVSCIGSYS